MSEFLSTATSAALYNNLVLIQLLGLSAFFAGSAHFRSSLELAQLLFLVMLISCSINLLIYYLVLAPLAWEILQLPLYALCGATLSSLGHGLLRRHFALVARRQDIALLFFGGSSAVVGTSLLAPMQTTDFTSAWAFILGSSTGFVLLLLLFAALRERLDGSQIPRPFRGAPAYFICAGIASLCLLGLQGI